MFVCLLICCAALSSDAFQALAAKRGKLLEFLSVAIDERHRKLKAAQPIKRKFQTSQSKIVDVAVKGGLYTVLTLLRDAANSNPELCLDILDQLKDLLDSVPVLAFSPGEGGISDVLSPELTKKSLEASHLALVQIASSGRVSPELQACALEVLLSVACTSGSLSVFLSCLQLLLFPLSSKSHTTLDVYPLLTRLDSMRRHVFMEEPSEVNFDASISVTELSSTTSMSIATDGQYLYCHCRAGLFKVGTGKNGSTPGLIYAEILGYRGMYSSLFYYY